MADQNDLFSVFATDFEKREFCKFLGGGASILMYTHYMKKPKYTYTLIYINIHKLSFYSALSVNHIMHLNDVFEELLHCINSFDGRLLTYNNIMNINNCSFLLESDRISYVLVCILHSTYLYMVCRINIVLYNYIMKQFVCLPISSFSLV